MEVVVWDSDPVLPVTRAAAAGRVGQHGLGIVMAVAQGFEAQPEPAGKRITARIALPDHPGGDIIGQRIRPGAVGGDAVPPLRMMRPEGPAQGKTLTRPRRRLLLAGGAAFAKALSSEEVSGLYSDEKP